MKAVRVAALVVAGLASACHPPPPRQTLDRDGLKSQAEALSATAAEAALFSHEVSRSAVSIPFAWVHQQALGEEATKVVEALARPAPEEMRALQQRELDIAARLQDRVQRVAQSAHEPQALNELQAQFTAMANDAKSIADSL